MYIDLLKKTLIDYYRPWMEYKELQSFNKHWKVQLLRRADKYLRSKGFAIVRTNPLKDFDNRLRRWWPETAETMIGYGRMDNIEQCFQQIVEDKIDGDLIECGVWRGGATIFMRALVRESGEDRMVWVADSFKGLPHPDEKYAADKGDHHHILDEMAVSLEEVKENFKKYGLLDDGVQFLEGWFSETLPNVPIKKLALLRVDGDMYGSTMDILSNLYPKLSPGGYCIVDDYGMLPNCKKAVNDYRAGHYINDEIIPIDSESVYWRKS